MISEHFARSEFKCKCGCDYDTVDYDLLLILEAVRSHFGKPITISSGCRCVSHNAAVGGSDRSQHLYGRAADIIVSDTDPLLVYDLVDQMGVGGAGLYSGWVHVDSRTNGPARWQG